MKTPSRLLSALFALGTATAATAFVAAPSEIQAPAPTGEIKLYENKLHVHIPDGFTPMSAEEMAQKYPEADKRPDHVYNGGPNGDHKISFVQKAAGMPVTNNIMPQLAPMLGPQVKGQLGPNGKIIASENRQIHNRNVVYLEAEGEKDGKKVHMVMLITDLNGKLLQAGFVTPLDEWNDAVKIRCQKFVDSFKVVG